MKRAWVVGLATLAVLLVSTGVAVHWRAHRALQQATEEAAASREIKFNIIDVSPSADRRFEPVSAPASFRSAAVFQGHLYIASSAGLFEYDERGAALREFRVGRDLPASPLTRLAQGTIAGSREPVLVAATESEGVLLFDGSHFRQLRPLDRDARNVTSVLVLRSGQLLLGTARKGVLVYDGARIGVFHDSLKDLSITALAGDEGDFWAATLDRGVLHWHAGQVDTFTDENGLPDNAAGSIAIAGAKTYVGTSAGVALFEDGKPKATLAKGMFARALFADARTLTVGTIDEGLHEVALDAPRMRAPGRTSTATELNEVQQLFASGDALYAVTPDALYLRTRDVLRWKRVLRQDPAILADRNVSAVAGDADGRIWVGYFDRGLDILEGAERRARHVENDHVYCVNRIVVDAKRRQVDVATANGLAIFDSAAGREHIVGTAEGLISEHVTDVVLRDDSKVIATPAGLTFLDASGARSLYAFHGLVNNHVYALGSSGRRVLAGTLGGVSLLNDDQVLANLTTANSGLKHNWITAAVAVDKEWFLGTYGAGVMRLTADGRVEGFDVATAPFEVNPNAMLATDEFVLAGTLGRGLYVYDRARERWQAIGEGLPSMNVTALAEIGEWIYVGTDNGLVRVRKSSLR